MVYKMNKIVKIILLLIVLAAIGIAAKKGLIGGKVEEAATETQEVTKDAAETAKEAVTEAKDKVEEVAKDAAEATKEASTEAKEVVKDAAEAATEVKEGDESK